MQPIILASASPQRAEILKGLDIPFTVEVSQIDESNFDEADPIDRAYLLARKKAEDVASRNPDCIVIGSDTLVEASNGTLLEKPVDVEDTKRMLRLHSGEGSHVHSTICIISPENSVEGISSSLVLFKDLSEEEIEWWISTDLWKDRSGGFQIDGKGQLMIQQIEGDWSGIVGLPVFLLGELLTKVGYEW